MKILAIETSCDETACAIVEDARRVLANVIASQIEIHSQYGGVVPEVAAREHTIKIIPVIQEALEQAKLSLTQIDALAVTQGPGLITTLLIGTNTANALALLNDKPIIPVHHILGHCYSNWLEREEKTQFPIMILTVSGGHNELILMRGHGDFEIIGETLDDAAGEAFDKIARLLELGYPGGPAISRIAEKGNPTAYDFPRALNQKKNYDFSFSGLKTAVSKEVRDGMSEAEKADIAASFQAAVVQSLGDKLLRAAALHEVKEIHLAGGVSANSALRNYIQERTDLPFRYPKKIEYCTDNAAMIGAAAYFLPKEKEWQNIIPKANLVLEQF